MGSAGANAIARRWSAAGNDRRRLVKALGCATVGLAAPGWRATIGQAAAKGARDHPAIVALTAVLEDAAAAAGVPVAEILVQTLEAEDWPDGCLGLAGSDEACAEVITPGFRAVLTTPAGEVVYRTDERGNFRREPAAVAQGTLQVHFERTGGIAGQHDEIDLDTTNLPDTTASELQRLIAEADFWNLPTEIDEGTAVTDGYEYRVTVSDGARSHTVAAYGIASLPHPANQGYWDLVAWLEERLTSA